MRAQPPLLFLWIAFTLQSLGLAQPAPPKLNTVWDGVFTKAEVVRGEELFKGHCSQCHGEDLTRLGSVLVGTRFMDRWREDNLSSLLNNMRNTMPPGPRGRLNETEYLNILAYVLSVNGFPAGATPLEQHDLERVRIVGKDGPMRVPDFSLVTVVGCLGKDAGNRWILTHASEPVRTRNPREPSEKELAADMSRKPGDHVFHFLDTYEFASEFQVGRWMQAKGFLMWSPGNDRINLSWLKVLRPTCEVEP